MNLIPRSFFFDDFFEERSKLTFMQCDIYEQENSYVIEIDVPGYNKDQIDINVEKGYLTISVCHDEENNESEKNYIRKERFYGTTKRQFYVGDVNEEEIKAIFNDGVLKVIVPRKEDVSLKRKIEIE